MKKGVDKRGRRWYDTKAVAESGKNAGSAAGEELENGTSTEQ